MDRAGEEQYSEVVSASLKVNSSFLNASIFPNPTEKHLNLQINALSAGIIKYNIIDANGRKTHSFDAQLDEGINDFQIDIESLNPNHYFLQIEFNGEVILRPFRKV